MKILIHVDSLIRDFAHLGVLAELLTRMGHNVQLSSRMTTIPLIRLWRPDHIIHSLGDQIGGLFDAGLMGRKGVEVSFIPQEGSERHELNRQFIYNRVLEPDCLDRIAHIFCWNDAHRQWLLSRDAGLGDRLSVVGNPRLDIAKFWSGGGKPRQRIRIGFVGRFPFINKYNRPDFLELLTMGDRPLCSKDDCDWDELEASTEAILSQVATYSRYCQLIHYFMANTDYEVSLRPHHEEAARGPAFNALKAAYGDRVEIDHGFSIYEWASGLDAILTTASLTFAEAYIAGVPVISIDKLTRVSDYLGFEAREILNSYDRRFVPDTYDELMQTLEDCLADGFVPPKVPGMETYMKEDFSHPYTGSSLLKIARTIDKRVRAAGSVGGPSLVPAWLVQQSYWVQLFRYHGNQPSVGIDKHYHPSPHRTPDYIGRIVANILAEEAAEADRKTGASEAA